METFILIHGSFLQFYGRPQEGSPSYRSSHIHRYLHTCMHAHIHALQVPLYMYINIHTHACLVDVYIYTHIYGTQICTHVHIYTYIIDICLYIPLPDASSGTSTLGRAPGGWLFHRPSRRLVWPWNPAAHSAEQGTASLSQSFWLGAHTNPGFMYCFV